MIDPLIFKLSVQLTHLSILNRPGFRKSLLQSSYSICSIWCACVAMCFPYSLSLVLIQPKAIISSSSQVWWRTSSLTSHPYPRLFQKVSWTTLERRWFSTNRPLDSGSCSKHEERFYSHHDGVICMQMILMFKVYCLHWWVYCCLTTV